MTKLRSHAAGSTPASAFAPTVTPTATTSTIIITNPISFCRTVSRCGMPKIWAKANSMVAKMPLPDQMRPPIEMMPSSPAESFTPCSARMSSGCAVLGNVAMISS